MYHHALEIYLAPLNEKADRSEPSASIDTNCVMITPAIYTRVPEALPPTITSLSPLISITLRIGSEADAQQEHQRTEHTK